ncbi:hypothetical protein CDV31_016361 [Fusarium ambrosium]|uniref:Amine oxidase domain-containing protein n=1 Tax=Fusarium ambrosium TaxID=131363 RepID=A0A428SA67_9HYPO|nr:hypothetical protein CDV31_016361 [Fusarium ambrosium]
MHLSNARLVIWASLVPHVISYAYKPPSNTYDYDVAIIGGGSGGIHAAIQLKDAGAKVVVIEKRDQIGGHAETYTDPSSGIPANIGVVIFEDTEVVNNYLDRLKVAKAKGNPAAEAGAAKLYDFSLGIPIPPQTPEAQAASQKAMATHSRSTPKKLFQKLTQPFGEFAQQHGFSAFLPSIVQFNWYPGNISTIPTLYGLKSLGPGLLKSIAGGFVFPASGDTRTIYKAAAAELGDSVLLESTVVHVQRNKKDGVVLIVQQPNHAPRTIRARKLVVAAPPTLENLEPFDLDKNEYKLFSKLSGLGYFAGIADIPGINGSFQNVGALTPFNTPVIPGSNGYYPSGTPNQVTLGVAFDTTDYTDSEAEDIIRRELGTLAAVGALPADAAEKVTFPYVSNHAPYNLRVCGKEIRNGYYRKLLKLQGSRNTYWTGATFAGHNSGLIWTWNEGTVLPALKKDLGL